MGNPVPVHRLSKKELIWLASHYCKHRVPYISHYSCYLKEHPEEGERIGFLDIETSNLHADFGIILSYCIKDSWSDKIYEAVISAKDVKRSGEEDVEIVKKCIKDMGKFDRLVTYYGKRFDIPFIRTRALVCKIPFPEYGTLVHTDLYDTVKHRFRLHSNRLEAACRTILGKTDKTHIDPKYWRGGLRGDPKSLRYILDHNRKDVLDLEKLYNVVAKFSRKTNNSI